MTQLRLLILLATGLTLLPIVVLRPGKKQKLKSSKARKSLDQGHRDFHWSNKDGFASLYA